MQIIKMCTVKRNAKKSERIANTVIHFSRVRLTLFAALGLFVAGASLMTATANAQTSSQSASATAQF